MDEFTHRVMSASGAIITVQTTTDFYSVSCNAHCSILVRRARGLLNPELPYDIDLRSFAHAPRSHNLCPVKKFPPSPLVSSA